MKTVLALLIGAFALFIFATSIKAGQGTPTGEDWRPYADVYVTWDGVSDLGDWWVDKNLNGSPEDDAYGCDNCVGVDYEFKLIGKTLQFDEVYVDAVDAHPQSHHVVLKETGEGVFTGSIVARYDYEASLACPNRMDVIEYTVIPGAINTDDYFNYIENEYCLD